MLKIRAVLFSEKLDFAIIAGNQAICNCNALNPNYLHVSNEVRIDISGKHLGIHLLAGIRFHLLFTQGSHVTLQHNMFHCLNRARLVTCEE